MCSSAPKSTPPPPMPVPPPRPMEKVKKVSSTSRKERKASSRKGGQRSLVINRTAPKIGSSGSGASAY